MLIALTGATGFIGSHIARALHAAGHTVRALARRQSPRDHVVPWISQWITGDQADEQSQGALVAGADAVIHNSADWEALQQLPVRHFERNILGSLSLLEQARLAGVEQFMFVSSVAVHHEIPDSAAGRITEQTVTWPNSLYGAWKASIEPFLKAYHHTYRMNTSAWRPAAVYGIDPKLADSQWHDLVLAAKQGRTVDTAHGGKITHVQDVADALTLAVGDPNVSGQFFDLVDCYIYWQQAAEFAREFSASGTAIIDRKGPGPKNQFDCAKAIAFFDRHGNHTALRRGTTGVREYVAELLRRM